MAHDLFGPHNAAWERFKTPAPKKRSRFVPAPVKVLTVPEEMAEKIRQQRAQDAYAHGLETLQQWKGKLSPEAYAKAEARVRAMKP